MTEIARVPGSLQLPTPATPDRLAGEATYDLAWTLLAQLLDESRDVRGSHLDMLLGNLGQVLALKVENVHNRFSTVSSLLLLRQLQRSPNWRPDLLHGAVILNVGCGTLNPLGGLIPLFGLGAAEVMGLDLAPFESTPFATRVLYSIASDMMADPRRYLLNCDLSEEKLISNLRRLNLDQLRVGDFTGLPDEVAFVQRSADRTELLGQSVDISISMSFLEHVPDPAAVLAEIFRISKPGSIAVHRIDGSDHWAHGDGMHALSFLAEETDEKMVRNCNRIRPTEFVALFQDAGFTQVDFQPERTIDLSAEMLDSFVEPFRTMSIETLSIVGGTISAVVPE